MKKGVRKALEICLMGVILFVLSACSGGYEEKKDTPVSMQEKDESAELEVQMEPRPAEEEQEIQTVSEEKIENTENTAEKIDEEKNTDDTKPKPKANSKYGRILYVGDSRTIDMFEDSDKNIYNEVHDGIVVYGGHSQGLHFMDIAVEFYGMNNFDTLLSSMGGNENGNFEKYPEFYEKLIEQGKNVIVCTVGPTDESYLQGSDIENYPNELIDKYNEALLEWAGENGIKVIDINGFIKESETVNPDPEDGIHYLPRPTTELWEFILSEIDK